MSLQISIRDEKPAEPQPVMKLWLEQRAEGVFLRGEDTNGDQWHIAEIKADGIWLSPNIPNRTGWPLDDKRRLKLINR